MPYLRVVILAMAALLSGIYLLYGPRNLNKRDHFRRVRVNGFSIGFTGFELLYLALSSWVLYLIAFLPPQLLIPAINMKMIVFSMAGAGIFRLRARKHKRNSPRLASTFAFCGKMLFLSMLLNCAH